LSRRARPEIAGGERAAVGDESAAGGDESAAGGARSGQIRGGEQHGLLLLWDTPRFWESDYFFSFWIGVVFSSEAKICRLLQSCSGIDLRSETNGLTDGNSL
jgi:hypothetical protein